MPMPFTYAHASDEFRAYLTDARDRLDTPSDNVAYTCTDAVFQVFRSRLAPQRALDFADVLPSVLRAIFVWRWRVDDPIRPYADRAVLTREVKDVRRDHNFSPDSVIGDIAWALNRHVDAMDFARVVDRLGPSARAYWQPPPDAA